MNKSPSKMNWKQKLLALAIALVTVSFVFTAIYMVFDRPMYEDFCGDRIPVPIDIQSQESCVNASGMWISYEGASSDLRSEGYCDFYSECSKIHDSTNSQFRRNVFIVALISGLVLLVGGMFIPVSAVSAGLMGGGLFTLFIGIIQYWDELANVMRLLILGIALAVLIYVGVKKLR